MPQRFISVDRDTPFMLPPSINDWLPEGHLARFVVEIVQALDLRKIEDAYTGRGEQAHSPEVLLGLLFYGYATGVFSSRKLEQASYDSVAFRYVTGDTHPDHDTIATFRKRFIKELKPLFLQVLQIAQQMGCLKLGKVSLDGTKVKANASKHRALSYKHAGELEEQLKAEVAQLLQLAEEADKAEVPADLEIPAEVEKREIRLAAIAKAKAEIERRAGERYRQETAEYERKVAERKEKEEKSGKKPRGKDPQPPQAGPRDKDQVNLTDEESRIMPCSSGGFEQGYNGQASVDVDTMLIVGEHVSQNTNDKQEVGPALEELNRLAGPMGAVEALLADTGYFSEANVRLCEAEAIVPYISTHREKHNQWLKMRLEGKILEEPPEGSDAVELMKHRLQTDAGRKVYAKRKSTVETVFGIIKAVMGYRQFLLRGLECAQGEWDLVCTAYNLKRLHALR
jgi:transposase